MPTLNEVVAGYVKLRDERDALKKVHSAAMSPYKEKLDKMEGWLLRELQRQGAKSVNTPDGTCYQQKRTSSKVEDWDAALAYVLKHDLLHFLERRISKAALEEFLEANGELPPGVSMTSEIVCNVRRS